MGLSQSCLRAPATAEFEAPIKAGVAPASIPSQLESEVKFPSCVPVCNARDATTNGDVLGSAEKIAVCADPAAGKGISNDTALETAQLSGALTATGTTDSLQSTFVSTEGYPHSSWDLGPPTTDDEQSRVQALRALDILDCVSNGRRLRMDEEADMVLGALMETFNAMTALLVLFDDTRIIIRNARGVLQAGEFPYRWSFCAYTLTKHRPQTLVVPDATKDGRFMDNPFVLNEPYVRFYCGAPLVAASGHIIGTICFADNKPRPDFDMSNCCFINNIAELLVRHLERYRANAGPSGPVDAETTAVARVARTIECYEAVTGMVDISLQNGWMLMYANEAWETLCAPWTRKLMVGRPLQHLLLLEEAPEEEAPEEEQQQELSPAVEQPAAGSVLVDDAAGMIRRPMLAANIASKFSSLQASPTGGSGACGDGSTSTSGTCVTTRYPSATSSSGGDRQCGIVVHGGDADAMLEDGGKAAARQAKLVAMQPAGRRQRRQQQERQTATASPWEAWRRHEGALRAGAEVDLGRARVLLEDGRPSSTLVRVTVRSANCHVLDAAVRMPVGVPHQLGLPTSILAAGNAASDGESAAGTPAALDQRKQAENAAQRGAATAQTMAEEAAVESEPCYCIVNLTRIENGDARGSDQEGENGDASGGGVSGGNVASPPIVPSTPTASALLPAARGGGAVGPADLASPITSTRPSFKAQMPSSQYGGRPSLDNGSCLSGNCGRPSRVTPGSVGGRTSTRGSYGSCSASSWTYGMEPFPGLKLGHLLGKGGYGRVFLASYKGQTVAAKVISNASLKAATCVNGVTLEALLAQEVEHPYIVRTYKCIIRSYTQDGGPSFAGMSTRHSTRKSTCFSAACGTPSERGGGGAAPYRSQVPPPTSSALSVVPGGSNDGGIDAHSACSKLVSPSQPGQACEVKTAGRAGGSVLATDHIPRAIAAASAAAPQGASVPVATHAAPAVAVAAPQSVAPDMEFDSFDAGGGEAACGMIDQLMSGGTPVTDPRLVASHLVPPSVASHTQVPLPLPLPPHILAEERTSIADSMALAQSVARTHGSISTCTIANVDEMVAPPRVPPGITGPADLFGTGADGGVFSTGAAAAGAAAPSVVVGTGACADASCRDSGRAPQDTLPEGETWILQEFCGRGTLQEAVDSGRLRTEPSRLRGKPHMPHILMTAQEIASAMSCVHSRGYMHGDLSAVNVLLTDAPAGSKVGGIGRGWIAKVSDFGLAKHLSDPNQPYVSSAYGVITHCAPEVLKLHQQSQKADCYSFGVLLWQMFTGSRPWANMNRFQIFGAVTSATAGLRFLPSQQPPQRYRELTMRCLSLDPAARPTFAEICEELRLMTYEAVSGGMMGGA